MHSSNPNAIPLYGSEPDEPGLYLGLFHGRKDPDDQMIEWGFNGPLIGPLSFVHTTYTNVIKLGFISAVDEKRYFPTQDMPMLTINGDMVYYQDCYYGDWTVFYATGCDIRAPEDTFRQSPRPVRTLYAHHRT
jgi:hypothetical protein